MGYVGRRDVMCWDQHEDWGIVDVVDQMEHVVAVSSEDIVMN
jgi:hypothetical protein